MNDASLSQASSEYANCAWGFAPDDPEPWVTDQPDVCPRCGRGFPPGDPGEDAVRVDGQAMCLVHMPLYLMTTEAGNTLITPLSTLVAARDEGEATYQPEDDWWAEEGDFVGMHHRLLCVRCGDPICADLMTETVWPHAHCARCEP